ncbi:MAG TPA: hypothetical protein VIG24_09355 [Acidimicrobiia bacterium]
MAEARYDEWRTAAPPEPRYGWDEFAQWLTDNPDSSWDADSQDDLDAFIDMMEQQDADARGEAAAERAEADRDDDDRDYWGGL